MSLDDFPPRLRTHSSERVKRLLDDAAREAPPSERMSAVVASVVAATTGGASARGVAWAKLVALCGAGGLAAAIVVASAARVERTPVVIAPVAVTTATSVLPREPTPEPQPVAPLPTPTETAMNKPRPPAAPAAMIGAHDDTDEMTIELQRLLAIRARVLAKDPKGALEGIDAYERAYPRGAFVPEAEAMAIDALADSERVDEAKARADRFLARYPASPQAPRIRALRERLDKNL